MQLNPISNFWMETEVCGCKGNVVVDDYIDVVKSPRKSWEFRKEQFKAGREEGLAEWQCNPYYCAGRVLVPALLDTIACHSFLGKV